MAAFNFGVRCKRGVYFLLKIIVEGDFKRLS